MKSLTHTRGAHTLEEVGGFQDQLFIARPELLETVFVNLTADWKARRDVFRLRVFRRCV